MRIFVIAGFSLILVFGQTAPVPVPQGMRRAPGTQQGQPPQQEQEPPEVKPEDKCSLDGTVLNGATGEPVSKATLMLRRTDTQAYNSAVYSATTDASGHYTIKGVDPGKYSLMAQRNGFVQSSYGAKPNARFGMGTTITLMPAAAMSKMDIKLTPQGVVTGRVVDEDGDPLANVMVRAMQPMYQNGRKTLRSFGGANTNDKGEYRMFSMAPGKYLISAVYRDPYSYTTEIRSGNDNDYAPVFYPSTTSPQGAIAVDVPAGREIGGIDLRVTKMKLPSISGTVAGAGRGAPTNVMLIARDSAMQGYEGMKSTLTDSRGRFLFRGITPGRYTLTARSMMQDQRFATSTVDVTTQNVEDVQLVYAPPSVIPATVRIEGKQDVADLKSNGTRVSLRPLDGGMMFGSSGADPLKDDGTFDLKGFAPDRYVVVIFPPSDTLYVKAVRAGQTEVSEPVVDLTGPAPDHITITLSAKAAQVQGSVKGENDKPAAGATVVLIPEDPEKSYLYKTGMTDQDGRYTLKTIPPGRYKLIALESVDFGQWQDPDFIKPLEPHATTLVISEGAQETKDLKVVAAPAN